MIITEYIRLFTTTTTTTKNKGESTKELYNDYLLSCKINDTNSLYDTQNKFTSAIKKLNYKTGNGAGNKTIIIGLFLIVKPLLFEVKPLTNKEEFDNKIKDMYYWSKDNILYDTTNTNRIINDEVEKLKSINEIVGYKNYNWSMAVKAQMGTGKTEKLVEYIKENPQLRVLIASFRKSLISKQFKELESIGFKTYLDFEGFKIVNEPKMIVQIDSLYKVFGEYDLIILDEVKSINEQLVLQVKNKIKCISALIERVKMTPMLYIADANLIIDDLEFFNKCGRQFVIYNNMYKKHTTKSMAFIENKNIMLNAILDDLSNNKKLIVPTGSKEFAISVQETINEKLPHIKVKLYTGGKKYEKDPTEEWIEYDCVICSVMGWPLDLELFPLTNRGQTRGTMNMIVIIMHNCSILSMFDQTQ